MKNNIKINKPCTECWENMEDFTEGKFCEKCSKCVVDFTDKTGEQIHNIFENAEEKEICGRILSKSFSGITAGIILMTNLTFIQAQTRDNFDIINEQKMSDVTKISGRLILKNTKKKISNAEVFFIHKSKYIKTTTDEKGNFVLDVPNELIKKENVLYFNFDEVNEVERKNNNRRDSINSGDFENKAVIILKKEKLENKEFIIDSRQYYLGGAIIMRERPPDYYYFNGRGVNEKKFEKLRKENPQYQFFFFDNKEAKVIAGKSYLETVSLLFSN
jgi:hypothetical protein